MISFDFSPRAPKTLKSSTPRPKTFPALPLRRWIPKAEEDWERRRSLSAPKHDGFRPSRSRSIRRRGHHWARAPCADFNEPRGSPIFPTPRPYFSNLHLFFQLPALFFQPPNLFFQPPDLFFQPPNLFFQHLNLFIQPLNLFFNLRTFFCLRKRSQCPQNVPEPLFSTSEHFFAYMSIAQPRRLITPAR